MPPALRVGGAFMALAVLLGVLTFVEVVTNGFMAPFELGPRFVGIMIAAIIIGAYAPRPQGQQQPSIARPIALALALLLVVGGRFIPNPTWLVLEQYWLPAYALMAVLASLFLRRSVM